MKTKLFIAVLAISASTFITPIAQAADIQGAGSSFAANFIEKCRVAYTSTGNSVSYVPNGSSSGRNQLTLGLTDFAISDTPYGSAETLPKQDFVYVPLIAGPIAISYKIDGYKGTLRLTKINLTKIFSGKITKWNDPLLQKDNPSKLPAKPIRVIYRADGSGTSEIFTTYLNTVAKDIWTKTGNKSFASGFPGDINKNIGGFVSASGSQGVKFLQSTTDGSIAYNEVSYTTGFGVAYVENGAGNFVKPTVNAASKFLSDFTVKANGVIVPNYNNTNKMSYNISTFSYGLAPLGNKDVAKFFTFALTKCKATEFGYSPITGNALKLAKSQIAKIG